MKAEGRNTGNCFVIFVNGGKSHRQKENTDSLSTNKGYLQDINLVFHNILSDTPRVRVRRRRDWKSRLWRRRGCGEQRAPRKSAAGCRQRANVTVQISSAGSRVRAQEFSVISVFQKPPNRTPKFTENHRNTPKAAAGAGVREIGCAGRSHLVHVQISTGKPATARLNSPSRL